MGLWFYGTVDGVPIEATPRDPDSHITVLETSSAVGMNRRNVKGREPGVVARRGDRKRRAHRIRLSTYRNYDDKDTQARLHEFSSSVVRYIRAVRHYRKYRNLQ